MSAHIIGVAIALQDYAFWLGATLVFCGISGDSNEASFLKAFSLGAMFLLGFVAATLILGDEAQRVSFPFPPILATALPGIWTGLRWWQPVVVNKR